MPTKRRATMGHLIDYFLIDKKSHSKPTTYSLYARYLTHFRSVHAELKADEMTRKILQDWIAKQHGRQSNSSKRMAARAVLAVLHRAYVDHLIAEKPIRGYRKPADGIREIVITPKQYASCVKASEGPLRTAVKFLWHTGCRPREFMLLEAGWLSGRKLVLPKAIAKTKRRNIYLNEMAAGIVKQLSKQHPSGPLFRRPGGKPWNNYSLVYQFKTLRESTHIEGLVAYTMRHTFITRLLERGVDIATVAELARTSPRMILEVYNHVAANESRLLDQLG